MAHWGNHGTVEGVFLETACMSGLFVVAIAVVGWLLYQKYFRALLAEGKIGRIKIAVIALGLALLVLVVTGRAPAIFAAIGALMTMVMRFLPLLLRAAPWLSRYLGLPAVPGAEGRISQVRTATLLMSFNAETGAMHGQVLAGEFSGRTLDALSDDELESLHSYCRRADIEGLRLLESWLVRERPESWGAKPGTDGPAGAGKAPTGGSGMSLDEACEVLDVDAGAGRNEIVAAHRSLMVRLHPDKGGSHYLAAKVNEAKRVLLDSSSARG